jgi:hypothetical protein
MLYSSSKGKAILLAGAGILVILAYFTFHEIERRSNRIDFNTDIRPIINNKCITCHGGVKRSGGFSLLFADEALMPNESGKPAIVPGEPEKSELIRRIKHHDPEFRMPLEKEPLSEKEIELLTQWIKEGAEWELHWAFKKPEPVALPSVSSRWISNDIDKFIFEVLEEKGLQPSAQADRATLLRRVSLDLTGLPPTIETVEDFLKDDSADAYGKVVDRLLRSPRFGEHWASMWMDLARYADSKGYEKDLARSIWQYRDWLIKAFNEDKPYDEFIIEQLAGDLLPEPTNDQLIATAFHRNTLNNDEGGTDNEEYRVAAVMDRVNTTWNALQATTMECVRCHSHPYDPIHHEDYYRSIAFFNNTADADTWSDDPKLVTFTNKPDIESLDKIKHWISTHDSLTDQNNKHAADFMKFIRLPEPKIQGHSFDQIKKGGYIDASHLAVYNGGSSRLKAFALHHENQMLIKYIATENTGQVQIRMDSLSGGLLGTWYVKKNSEITSIPIRRIAGKHDLFFIFNGGRKNDYVCRIEWVLFYNGLPGEQEPGYPKIKKEFLNLLNSEKVITTPVMVEVADDYRRKTYVFERGNWLVHGKQVDPGVPDAWNSWPEGAPLNRLGMARWFVSKDNPLTARVMVNRLWARLFGRGIVETEEDFGSKGFAPSHPELLDWMAQQFMNEHGWSIKKQLRQLVMSATYQQSSRVTPTLRNEDPENIFLARGPRIRLTAEQIRDQALAVSGLLSEKMYGPSVMPSQPDGVWLGRGEWKTSEGEDKHRRALYTYVRRITPYPFMMTFDSPSREVCVVRRINTNTPLQALTTLNDPVFMEAALSLALKMRNADEVEEQIKNGYRIAMFKDIDREKLYDLLLLYQRAIQHFKDDPQAAENMTGKNDIPLAALTVVGNAIMNLDEFLTKS